MRHTLPAGVVGPGFNDEFGDTFGIIYGFTADGFTHRELRDYVEDVRSELLRVPDVSKVEILGAQDEKIFVEFSTEKLAGLGIDRGRLIAALQAQNAVSPAGVLQTGDERLALRVSGAFRLRAGHPGRQLRRQRPHDPAGRHRRGHARLRRSTAAHVPRQREARDRARHRHARRRRHPHARPATCSGRWRRSRPTCRSASSRSSSPISPPWSTSAIGEFMTSLWQAIAIIMVVSFVSLGVRAGAVVALVDSADARDRLSGHGACRASTCSAFRSARSSSR